jgi:hypothetical protein
VLRGGMILDYQDERALRLFALCFSQRECLSLLHRVVSL